MSGTDTLPELLRPLMGGTSVDSPVCAVCGRPGPLERHHVVRRGAGRLFRGGREVPKPAIALCGFGNALADAGGRPYCHGLAHHQMLHFRWVRPAERFNRPTPQGSGHWEWLRTDEPTRYQDALGMPGWLPLRGWRA